MDLDLYFRFAAALGFVVALIVVVGWLARRSGVGGRMPRAGGGKQRRVGIVEVLPLDAKRRLVLVRRDAVEHLILVGPGGDVVVEHGVDASASLQAPPPPTPSFETLLAEPKPEAAV